jgi:hypothetical protein
MDSIELGDTVKDRITGIEGVVMGHTRWLYGCDRITIQPQEVKDGKPAEMTTFDLPQLELVRKRVVASDVRTPRPGGPRPEPVRQPDPKR